MTLLHFLLPLALLQVGPNPVDTSPLGLPDELANRPARPGDAEKIADPTAAWLAECLDQIDEDPARAHSKAQIKLSGAIGPERIIANHCLGLASTELGLWDDARTAFIAARDETPADEARARARFGAMAGNAALVGGDAEGALTYLATAQTDAQTAASAPLQVIAALDTSRALVALGRDEEALAPLDTAISLAPEASEGWLLKATLLRRLKKLGDAQAAIEQAAALAPQDAEIGLEAGVIAVLSGREDAARTSWQSVIETAPQSVAATTATQYLAQIGTKPTVPQPEAQVPEAATQAIEPR
ncbi:MAG: tetratricopeptide repeat protein [Erythrobacter sp.]